MMSIAVTFLADLDQRQSETQAIKDTATMQQNHQAHVRTSKNQNSSDGRPYLMFWINMIIGLIIMYVVMFSMIDRWNNYRNNLNMFYMAVTMWAPMGIFMLLTMPDMFPNQSANIALCILFAVLIAGSFWATRKPALINDPAPFRSDPNVPRSGAHRA